MFKMATAHTRKGFSALLVDKVAVNLGVYLTSDLAVLIVGESCHCNHINSC